MKIKDVVGRKFGLQKTANASKKQKKKIDNGVSFSIKFLFEILYKHKTIIVMENVSAWFLTNWCI